jgi:hypothetical protein
MPQHVPPSDDVRAADFRAKTAARIRRAKWKHLAFWYIVAAGGIWSGYQVTALEAYWMFPWLTGLWVAVILVSQTVHADAVYRMAYTAGISMGMIASREISAHVRWHAERSEEACDEIGIQAVVPHVWEHPIVLDEIGRQLPGVFDDDDEEPRP